MNKDLLPRGLSFLAGTAAGLALGFYLHSEKGRALREQLMENWGDALDDLGTRTQEHVSELLAVLSGALDKGLDLVDLVENQLQENTDEAPDSGDDAFEDAEESFENGMDKARARLEQKFKDAGF